MLRVLGAAQIIRSEGTRRRNFLRGPSEEERGRGVGGSADHRISDRSTDQPEPTIRKRGREGLLLHRASRGCRHPTMHALQSRGAVCEMEEIESMVIEARQALLAGPAASDLQRRNLHNTIGARLPRAVELLQRQPMAAAVAKRCAKTFAVVQDFADICLRSPLLGEGDSLLDLSPLLHILRVLLSADAVAPRFLSASEAAAAASTVGGLPYFNQDHGKPLLREWGNGRSRRFWPDELAAGWVLHFFMLCLAVAAAQLRFAEIH